MSLVLTILAILGVAACWLAWRGERGDPRLLAGLGWSLLFVSIVGWSVRFGDSGTAIAVAAAVAAGLGFLGWSAVQQNSRPVARSAAVRRPLHGQASRSRLATFAVVVIAGPVAGLIALLVGLSGSRLVSAIGWAEPDSIVFTYAAVPLAWAGIAAYAATQDTPLRKAAILAGLAGLPLLHLLVSS